MDGIIPWCSLSSWQKLLASNYMIQFASKVTLTLLRTEFQATSAVESKRERVRELHLHVVACSYIWMVPQEPISAECQLPE